MTYVQNNGEKKIDWRVGPHESPVDRNQAGVNSSRSNIREGQPQALGTAKHIGGRIRIPPENSYSLRFNDLQLMYNLGI